MIKVRLLKEVSGQVYKLVEDINLGDLTITEGFKQLALPLGQLLSNYKEIISDPNMVSALIDTSIEDWSIRDIESIQAALKVNGFRLVITDEIQEDLQKVQGSIMYMLLDSSIKYEGMLPMSSITVRNPNPMKLEVLPVLNELMPEYFDKNKFFIDQVTQLMNSIQESYDITGVYDIKLMNSLYELLDTLNKELIFVIVQ